MNYKELKEQLKEIGLTLTTSRGVVFPYSITFSDGIQKGNTLAVCKTLKDVEELLKQNL